MNLLKLIDEDSHYYSLFDPIVAELAAIYNIQHKGDPNSYFKYKTDISDVEINAYDMNHEDRTFIQLSFKGVKEAAKKCRAILYIFRFNDGLYTWLFDEKDIFINYDFRGVGDIATHFSIYNWRLKPAFLK